MPPPFVGGGGATRKEKMKQRRPYAPRVPGGRWKFTVRLLPKLAMKLQDEFPDLSMTQAIEKIANERYISLDVSQKVV